MSDSITDSNKEETFPEEVFYRNSIVIGNLPSDVNLDQLFSFFHDAFFWKIDGRRIISDLKDPRMKATVLTFENEQVAKLCAYRIANFANEARLSLVDGMTFFRSCREMDCDRRSRNVIMSGFDASVPSDMYLDIFRAFGTVVYSEFRDGDIPTARIEFERVTSSFAAVISLQGTLHRDTLVVMEIPLFPVDPISPAPRGSECPCHGAGTLERYLMNPAEDRFCAWNYDAKEVMEFSQTSVEECRLGSYEISRRNLKEMAIRRRMISSSVYGYNLKGGDERLRRFLQTSKRRFVSYRSFYDGGSYSAPPVTYEPLYQEEKLINLSL